MFSVINSGSATLKLDVLEIAPAQILREEAPACSAVGRPAWRVRVVNVTDLQVIGIPQKYPHGLEEDRFQRLFPLGVPVVFNLHGYTAAIKQLLWERPGNERFDVNGYREEGTTTTPFDMQVRNKTSRWHLVILAAQKLAARNPRRAALAEELICKYEHKLREHYDYVRATSIDPPEILNWRWKARRSNSARTTQKAD